MTMPIALPYGLRDVKLVAYPTLAADVLGASLVDLPNAQTMSFNDTEEYTDLRGDDKLVTSHGQGAQVEWELTSGGISFAAHSILAGGEVVESGVAPNQRRRYRKLSGDQRPFFTAIGQSISDSGGDMHAIIWCCRSTDSVEGQFSDTEFMVPSVSGTGFPCRVPTGLVDGDSILDAVYDFVQHETIAAIVAPVLDTPVAPTVTSLSDITGPAAGGEIIRVFGTGFTGVVSVAFTATNAPEFEVISPFEMIVLTPAKAAGVSNLRVTNGAGQSATAPANVYTYV
jgi:hypothetical protein